jgi:hypothetical protein
MVGSSYISIFETNSIKKANQLSKLYTKLSYKNLIYLADGNYNTPMDKLTLLQMSQIVFVARSKVVNKSNPASYLLLITNLKKLNRIDVLK